MVSAAAATSSMRGEVPKRMASSPAAAWGMWVTSTRVMSMQTRPTTGARRPRIETLPRPFERWRG